MFPFQRIRHVILDLSGTIMGAHGREVIRPFKKAFDKANVKITTQEASKFMGLSKPEHFQQTLKIPSVANKWKEEYKREPDLDKDANNLFKLFQPLQIEELSNPQNIKALPRVIPALEKLSEMGITLGCTTGFTTKMTNTFLANSPEDIGQYFVRNAIISCDHPNIQGKGRPYPFGLYIAMINMGCESVQRCIKVGDTLNDIKEGENAVMSTLVPIRYCNYVGDFLSEDGSIDDLEKENLTEYIRLMNLTRNYFNKADPDYVVNNLGDLVHVIRR